MQLSRIVAVILAVLLGQRAEAQCGRPTTLANAPVVDVDLVAGRFAANLPFDQEFTAKVPFPEGVKKIEIRFGAGERTPAGGYQLQTADITYQIAPDGVLTTKLFTIDVPPLRPNTVYLFEFALHKTAADPVVKITIPARARTSLGDHFQTAFGVIRSRNAGYWGIASDAHLYLVPINKDENMCGDQSMLEHLAKRVSLFAGLSLVEVSSDVEVTKPFAPGVPIVGIGIRKIPYLGPVRVNTGVMFFEQDDANPIVARSRAKRDTFVSVGADIEVQKLLGPLFAFLGK